MINKIIDYISEVEEVDKSTLSAETNLVKDLDMTSLTLMQLCGEVEDEFDIEIPVEEVYGLETIGQLAGFIEKLINE